MSLDLATAPLGDLIRTMAMAVAEAQTGLDRSSFAMAEMMMNSRVQFGFTIDKDGNRIPNLLSMMELGFTPNFYQFVDTVIEVRLALQIEKSEKRIDPATGKLMNEGGGEFRVASQPLDAGYTSSYNYKLDFASVFKTKIVCVPPPAALEDRLREVMRQEAVAGAARMGAPANGSSE